MSYRSYAVASRRGEVEGLRRSTNRVFRARREGCGQFAWRAWPPRAGEGGMGGGRAAPHTPTIGIRVHMSPGSAGIMVFEKLIRYSPRKRALHHIAEGLWSLKK